MAALVAAPDVPAENETREDRVLIGEALARTVAGLPTIERLLLKLHFVRGVPLVDVAARLRLSKATIHRRMSRAIAACRAGVAAAGIEPGRAHGLALERNDEIAAILEGIDETIPPPGRLTPRDE
jgi:DNA-directed RNA polymerase specialized sigma24 family protein